MMPIHYHGFSAAPTSPITTQNNLMRVVPAGRFDAPIDDLSTAHWDANCGLLSPRRLQRKGWLYGAVFSERWIVGCAIADAGLLGSAFVYVFDRQSRRMMEYNSLRPLAFAADFQPSPNGVWALKQGDKSWRIQPLTDQSGWHFQFTHPDWDVSFELHDNRTSISALNNAPSASHRGQPSRPFHYTHKLTGAVANLRLRMHNETHELTDVRGVFDFTLGYPPRATLWQWASWIGQLDDGRTLSGNLVAQTMNGLENAVWIGAAEGTREGSKDGAQTHVIALPQAIFDDLPTDTAQTWQIRTADDRLRMQFTPEGARSERINLGLLASDFTQPFGAFRGVWRDDDGSEHTLTGIGVVERHRALW